METSPQSVASPLRSRVKTFVELPRFGQCILALILLNAVLLGMETSAALMAQYGSTLLLLDKILLSVFVVELLLRIFAYRAAFF